MGRRVLKGGLRGRTPDAEPEEAPLAPAEGEPSPSYACDVSGRVIAPDGDNLSGATVTSLTRFGRVLAQFAVEEDGSFGGPQPLPEPEAILHWIARAGDETTPWISLLVTRSVRAKQHVGLALYLRPAGMVYARAVCADGSPAPGAEFVVSTRPVRRANPLPTWEVEAVEPSLRTVACDEEGRIAVAVRPGHVHLRVRSSTGVWGAASLSSVEVGKRIDAGTHVVGQDPVRIRGRVVDATTGKGVGSAWFQLAGDLARLDDAGRTVPSLRTRDDGRFEILNLGSAALPLHAAVGSPRHQPEEVVFRDASSDLVLVLHRRPMLRIHVIHPTHDLADLGPMLQGASWTIFDSGSPGPSSTPNASPISQMTAILAHASPQVTPCAAPGEFETYLARPGTYVVRLALPGVPLCEERVTVARRDPAQLTLPLPSGPAIRVRVKAQTESAALAATKNWRLTWRGPQGKAIALADLVDLSEAIERGVVLLGPRGATRLDLDPRDDGATVYTHAEVALSRAAHQEVLLVVGVREPAGRIAFQLTLGDRKLPLGQASIWVLRQGTVNGPHFTTDASGGAEAWLRPGVYRAVSLRRFGKPRWVSFEVPARRRKPVEVRLPTDP